MKLSLTLSLSLLFALFAPSLAQGSSSEEAAKLFQAGVAKLEAQKRDIFTPSDTDEIEIKYDVKKTDSLISPIVGLLTVTKRSQSGVTFIDNITFSFADGGWEATKYVFTIDSLVGRKSQERPLSEVPVPRIQECFK